MIGYRDLDDAVEPAGSQERVVEDVGSVRGPDDLDVPERVESIEFREQLHEGALDLPVARRRDLEPLRPDAVEFVDEHDRWRLLARQLEEFADEARAFPDVLLHELRPNEPDEARMGAVRDGLREKGLAGPRRPDEEHAFRRLDANLAI